MRIYILFLFLVINISVKSQSTVENLLRLGKEDTKTILHAYMDPAVTFIGNMQSEGWNTTAWPLKFLRFEIGFTSIAALIPQTYGRYNPSSLGLKHFKTNSDNAATFLGSKTINGELTADTIIDGKTYHIHSIKLPDGLSLPLVAFGCPQASLGIGLGTEVSVRYLPIYIKSKGFDYQTYGIGAKHDLLYWTGESESINHHHLALNGFYSVTSLGIHTDVQPPSFLEGGNLYDFSNQKVQLDIVSTGGGLQYTWDVGDGTSLSVGSQFTNWSSSLAIEGNYPYLSAEKKENETNAITYVKKTSFPDKLTSENNVGFFNIGVKMYGKVGAGTFHVTYNTKNYFSCILGFSIGYIEKSENYRTHPIFRKRNNDD